MRLFAFSKNYFFLSLHTSPYLHYLAHTYCRRWLDRNWNKQQLWGIRPVNQQVETNCTFEWTSGTCCCNFWWPCSLCF